MKGALDSPRKPRILIGPFCDDPAESVSAVNRSLADGLDGKYEMIRHWAVRRFGAPRQGMFNLLNVGYFIRHLAWWCYLLMARRPVIAHYAINSGWAMEKGLMFFKIARLCGAKTVGHLHGGLFLKFSNSLPAWRRRLALRELHKLDAMIVLSEGWRDAVQKELGIDRTRLFVVNNPIDGKFEDAALQFPADRAEPVSILALGVMEKIKGVLDLLEAANLARDKTHFHLRIVGPEREPGILKEVQNFIRGKSLENCVTWEPGIWGAEKIEAFRHAAILVLPSYVENFPLVVLEAAAAGCAIITTPVGAVPEFFTHDDSAVFVNAGDTKELAEAIVHLSSSAAERRRLGTSAREVFGRRLARCPIMAALDKVYQCVIAGSDETNR